MPNLSIDDGDPDSREKRLNKILSSINMFLVEAGRGDTAFENECMRKQREALKRELRRSRVLQDQEEGLKH
jgi:hypothetical protein